MKFNVEGMTCSHCVRAIETAVAALGGVAQVDLASGTVEITGTEDTSAVRRAIEDEGYTIVDLAVAKPIKSCCAPKG